MRKPVPRFCDARDAFAKALADYQAATRDMNAALARMSVHTGDFCESLSSVIALSESMLDGQE
jgi:hypothetical protein